MIFSFMLVCVRPKGQNGGVVNVRSNSNYSAYMKTKRSGYGHQNNAYKDDFMMSWVFELLLNAILIRSSLPEMFC